MMNDKLGFSGISRGAIRHWRLLLLASLGLMLVAIMAWMHIPRLEDPLVEPPVVVVTIPYPGASAEDVEAQILKPVEDELFAIQGVDIIESRAQPNYAMILMAFVHGTPMDSMTETIRGKVLSKRRQLPPEVQEPIVERQKMATFTAHMVLVAYGNRSDGVLTDTAKRVKDAVMTVPGVASVTTRGGQSRAVRVRLDPVRLAQHHLTVDQVAASIKLSNVRVPGGEVAAGSLVTLLSVNHELKDAASIAQIPVGASRDREGATRTVTLGDVAEVRDDFRTATERMLHDGKPAVGLEVRFRPSENAVEVGKLVRAELDRARGDLPKGVELAISHDQPEWVRRSLTNFIQNLLEGIVLVMLVITLGMGWRSAVVVVVVLPLAIAGAIIGLYGMGMALDQVSIAGLIVALGLLVDDAVVVAESIQVMRGRGLSALRAAVLGTARVFWANNGTTAVACASFLPLFFMSGDMGQFIRGLPTAVVLALVTSLFVAQLLTPWISTFFVKLPAGVKPIPDTAPFDRRQDSEGEHGEANVVLRAIKALYAWSIPHVVSHPIKVIILATGLLVGSCMLLPKVGVQFFPKSDKPILFVAVELPRGTDQSVTAHKVAEVASVIAKDPAVRSTSAVIGGGYPVIFVGQAPHTASKDIGHILVRLSNAPSLEVAQRLRTNLASIPGAKTTVEELYTGPPVTHPVIIRLHGDDYSKLRQYADDVKARLREVPGTLNVSDSMNDTIPVAHFDIDADRALRVGITPGQIGAALRSVYGEDRLTSFRQGRDDVEVIIEGPKTGSRALGQVAETPVTGLTGAAVPLLAVGDVKMTRSVAELRRRNARPIVDVTADLSGTTLPAEVLAKVRPSLDKMKWEKGYGYSFQGAQAETEKGFKNLAIAATVTVTAIFILLVLMFGSLRRAAIVLAAIPYVLIGAIPGLYITKNPFGFMAFLGLVALIGVYVNHKIYFVDRMQELMKRGIGWRDAIRQAGIDRLRPVVLTALTAILGLLPLTLTGGAFWSAFGWVNIFGLAISIPLSLVLLPALLTLTLRSPRDATVQALAARPSDSAEEISVEELHSPLPIRGLPPLPPSNFQTMLMPRPQFDDGGPTHVMMRPPHLTPPQNMMHPHNLMPPRNAPHMPPAPRSRPSRPGHGGPPPTSSTPARRTLS